ncbi:MAG: hypothetical protein JWR80_9691 [Bradyrhizobium sp.]|nr:hypothetical protein [Bradyrhizobium sp.]
MIRHVGRAAATGSARLIRVKIVVGLLMLSSFAVIVSGTRAAALPTVGTHTSDRWRWLETRNPASETWVQKENTRTFRTLGSDPRFGHIYEDALRRYRAGGADDPRALIFEGPWVFKIGVGADHPHGQVLSTSLADFTKQPRWSVILDATPAGGDWAVTNTITCAADTDRCLVMLRNNAGETSWREFDRASKGFVADGFTAPAGGVQWAVWRDRDSLIVSTGKGLSQWRRGQPLAGAGSLMSAPSGTLGPLFPMVRSDGAGNSITLARAQDIQNQFSYWLIDGASSRRLYLPKLVSMPLLSAGQLVFVTGEDLNSGADAIKAGSVAAISLQDAQEDRPRFRPVFQPTERQEVDGGASVSTAAGVLLPIYDNVNGRLLRAVWNRDRWKVRQISLPDHGSIRAPFSWSGAADQPALVVYQSFSHSTQFFSVSATEDRAEPVVAGPANANGGLADSQYETKQVFVASSDGALIPYFVVRRTDLAKPFQASPTLVHAYGASGDPQLPIYDDAIVRNWLDQGGVYVVANIRGGGEFGPRWNLRGADRRLVYDDLLAVARDLVRTGVAKPKHLGLWGASSGGMLAGVMLTQHPEVFSAIISEVPVLDLFRYDLLMGGEIAATIFGSASDPRERRFMAKTSPFQNIRAGAHLPTPLIMTSATDINANPASGRRFAAKMAALGKPFYYYESPDGGHSMYATPEQHARYDAVFFTYLYRQLMLGSQGHSD